MKNYKKMVKLLYKECEIFLEQVEALGNECAWTDRMLENILETADKIKKDYEEEVSL